MIKSISPLLVRQNLLVATLVQGTGGFFVSCNEGAPEAAGYRESVNRFLDRAEEEGLERLADSLVRPAMERISEASDELANAERKLAASR